MTWNPRGICAIGLTLAIAVGHSTTHGYEVRTHGEITRKAYDTSEGVAPISERWAFAERTHLIWMPESPGNTLRYL